MDIHGATIPIAEQSRFDIRDTVGQISKAANPELACLIAKQHFLSEQIQLISVLFCDQKNFNYADVARPFCNISAKLTNIANKIREHSVCPIAIEALRILRPFEIGEIDRSRYDDLLSSRFLDEISKMSPGGIFVVPVILGRGLGLFMVSAGIGSFSSDDKLSVIDSVCQISVAIISRFPEITTFFESKRLSTQEAKTLFLNSSGYSDAEIGRFLNLSEIAVGLTMKSAGKKLNAKNRSQTVAIALAFGEISNMQFSDQARNSHM